MQEAVNITKNIFKVKYFTYFRSTLSLGDCQGMFSHFFFCFSLKRTAVGVCIYVCLFFVLCRRIHIRKEAIELVVCNKVKSVGILLLSSTNIYLDFVNGKLRNFVVLKRFLTNLPLEIIVISLDSTFSFRFISATSTSSPVRLNY